MPEPIFVDLKIVKFRGVEGERDRIVVVKIEDTSYQYRSKGEVWTVVRTWLGATAEQVQLAREYVESVARARSSVQ